MKLVSLRAEVARPTRIHARHCAHCPSVASPDDPELVDMKTSAPRAQQIESVFHCAWRHGKACRGYCDELGIEEADLAEKGTA